MEVPRLADYRRTMVKLESTGPARKCRPRWASCACWAICCATRRSASTSCPIVPDESRTFGMEGLFRQVGIYAHAGQLYEPVDSDQLAYYKEAKDGQMLEEGITEAGSMSSFIAAGTAYSSHGVNMIPLFIYYSMFGFQRIGDLIWAAADARAKGFMLGGTAGRTTLNGEGLQHQDGHSLLNAIAFPTVRAYDPAFAYEMAVIVLDGLKRMYEDNETAIYYITLENENYDMPAMPAGVRRRHHPRHVQVVDASMSTGASTACSSSAAAPFCASAASPEDPGREVQYGQRRLERHQLHGTAPRRAGVRTLEHAASRRAAARSYFEELLEGVEGPFIAASRLRARVPEQISPGCPAACTPWAPTAWAAAKPARPASALRSRCRVHRRSRRCTTQATRQVRRPVRGERRQRSGDRSGEEISAVRVSKIGVAGMSGIDGEAGGDTECSCPCPLPPASSILSIK